MAGLGVDFSRWVGVGLFVVVLGCGLFVACGGAWICHGRLGCGFIMAGSGVDYSWHGCKGGSALGIWVPVSPVPVNFSSL